MSPEPLQITYEPQRPVDRADGDINLDLPEQNQDNHDPIASFLEKHGHKLVENHEGQAVTVAEAMGTCAPFRALVLAMGEGALALVAPKLQEQEELAEESDTDDELQEPEPTEDKLEPEKTEKPKPETQDKQVQKPKDVQKKAEPIVKAEESPIAVRPPEPTVRTATPVPEASEAQAPSPTPRAVSVETVAPLPQPEPVYAQPFYEASRGPAAIIQPENVQPAASAEPIESPNEIIIEGVNERKTVAPLKGPQVHVELDKPAIEAPSFVYAPYESQITKEELNSMATEKLDKIDAAGRSDKEDIRENLYIDEAIEQPYEAEFLKTQEDLILPKDDSLEKHFTTTYLVSPSVVALQSEQENFYGYEALSYELALPAKRAETSIYRLAEAIAGLEAEKAETAVKILDQIAQLPAQIEVTDEGEGVNKQDIREELWEKFAELFEQVRLDYSSELIETLVELAISNNLKEVGGLIISCKGANAELTDKGTHETLTKLLAITANTRKSLAIAYARFIGRSAVRHYGISILAGSSASSTY